MKNKKELDLLIDESIKNSASALHRLLYALYIDIDRNAVLRVIEELNKTCSNFVGYMDYVENKNPKVSDLKDKTISEDDLFQVSDKKLAKKVRQIKKERAKRVVKKEENGIVEIPLTGKDKTIRQINKIKVIERVTDDNKYFILKAPNGIVIDFFTGSDDGYERAVNQARSIKDYTVKGKK